MSNVTFRHGTDFYKSAFKHRVRAFSSSFMTLFLCNFFSECEFIPINYYYHEEQLCLESTDDDGFSEDVRF